MVPLSALVSTQWVSGPDLLPHFNAADGNNLQDRSNSIAALIFVGLGSVPLFLKRGRRGAA